MKNKYLLAVILLFNLLVYSQEKHFNFAIKAGVNFSKYKSDNNSIDYKFKTGFFVGASTIIEANDKWSLNPEVLFALQGTEATVNGIEIVDSNGNTLPNTASYNFEYEINEFAIEIPLIVKWHIFNKFFLEAGPQVRLIVDRSINSSQQLLNGTNSSSIQEDYDIFDFGFAYGVGFDISNRISINARYFLDLIKRDNDIKSTIFSFGLEYRI